MLPELFSSRWQEVCQPLSGQGRFVCTYFTDFARLKPCPTLPTFPQDLFEDSRRIRQKMLVRLVLNKKEKEFWYRGLGESEKRKVQWLLGRATAKDAVRLFLKERYQMELRSADIGIENDRLGKPCLKGGWLQSIPVPPFLSLAHTEGFAVAVAGEVKEFPSAITGIGIDVEPVQELSAGFISRVFRQEEKDLADKTNKEAGEWLLRFWCVKEAVSKALGSGIRHDPKDIAILSLDQKEKRTTVRLTGRWTEQFPEKKDKDFLVSTFRKGEFVIALVLL